MTPSEAESLIRIVATSGASWITFAGGDPSLRPDIVPLINFGRAFGLRIEVQTNAEVLPRDFKDEILRVDQVGLSLDGHDADSHDKFRSCPGNYSNVLSLLDDLAASRTPTVVRTVVSRRNADSVPLVANVLTRFPNVKRWSLLEFTPLGDGYVNREEYRLPSDAFWSVVRLATHQANSRVVVDGFANSAKAGTYALVTPDGRLYGTVSEGHEVRHRVVGHMLADHLSDLAAALPFDVERHQLRYGGNSPGQG